MRRLSHCPFLLALVLASACDSAVPPPAAPASDAAMNALLERLDRLIASLHAGGSPAATAATPSAAPATEVARTPMAGAAPDLEARLTALEQQLTELRILRIQHMPSMAADSHTPKKVVASVDQLAAQLAEPSTREDARRSLFLITQAEALRRFGMPDYTSVTDQGYPQWGWETSSEGSHFGLTFIDGIAVHIDD